MPKDCPPAAAPHHPAGSDPAHERSRWMLILALIAAAAFMLRAAWIFLRWGQGGAAFEFDDERLHWQLATNLVLRGELVSDDGRYAARMPLYPLFLAPFAALGELGVLFARLAQALLGAGVAVCAASLAARAFGRRAGLVAGLLAVADPYAIFFSNLLLTEVLFTLTFVALVGACAGCTGRARLLTALLGPAAILIRPSAAGVVALLWAWQFWQLSRRSAQGRLDTPAAGRAVRPAVVLAGNLLALVVLFAPWGLRNLSVLGAPAWLSTNGGVTLYDAQGPQADGRGDQSFLLEMPELAALSEVERDRRLRDLALAQMRADPARVAVLAWRKFLRTWSLAPNVADYRVGLTAWISAVFTAGVLALAFIGLWRTRQRGAWHLLLWLPVVYFTLLHCIYIGSLRYRIPLMPFLEIVAAAGVCAAPGRDRDAPGGYHVQPPIA